MARSRRDDDEDELPRKKPRRPADDEDERPLPKKKPIRVVDEDDDEDEEPLPKKKPPVKVAKSKPVDDDDDEDDDEPPPPKKKPVAKSRVVDEDEEDDDEERPTKKKLTGQKSHDDDDDDEEDDDTTKRKSKYKAKRQKAGSKKLFLIGGAAALLFLLCGGGAIAGYFLFFNDSPTAAVQEFIDGTDKGDGGKMWDRMDKSSQDDMTRVLEMSKNNAKHKDKKGRDLFIAIVAETKEKSPDGIGTPFGKGKPVIQSEAIASDGKSGSVIVKLADGKIETIPVVKEDGKWRVKLPGGRK